MHHCFDCIAAAALFFIAAKLLGEFRTWKENRQIAGYVAEAKRRLDNAK